MIKYLDLIVIFTLFFILASIASLILNRMWFYDFNPETNTRPTWVILCQVIIEIILTGFAGYFIRNFIAGIQFPYLNGDYTRQGLVELSGGVVFAFSVLSFQQNLKRKSIYLFDKIQKKERNFFIRVFGKDHTGLEK